MICVESLTKLPCYEQFFATNCFEPAPKHSETIVSGFIKRYFTDYERVPMDVIRMIMTWYPAENVLLLQEDGHLWKMSVEEIMKNLDFKDRKERYPCMLFL